MRDPHRGSSSQNDLGMCVHLDYVIVQEQSNARKTCWKDVSQKYPIMKCHLYFQRFWCFLVAYDFETKKAKGFQSIYMR